MTLDPTLPPSSKGGWSQSVQQLEDAVIVPPKDARRRVLETGLLDKDGGYVPFGATWRREEPVTTCPDMPEAAEALEGTWLWGGVFYHHFGHFQVESISRLWAIRRFREEVQGVVFASRKGATELADHERDYLRLLIGDVPVKLVTKPARAEKLIVPGQGFGLGEIANGTRIFRRFIAEDFARDVLQQGGPDLFISRSKQSLNKGGFVGESFLDARMAEAGYDVFWPEEHSVETQVARYKAARRVVALDGSALHLFAMVGRKDQDVAVILRRKKAASRSLRKHLARFTKAKPLVINALAKGPKQTLGKKRHIGQLDFEHIGRLLKQHGFLKRSQEWGALSEDELAAVSARYSA